MNRHTRWVYDPTGRLLYTVTVHESGATHIRWVL